jgi:hypothetical protein
VKREDDRVRRGRVAGFGHVDPHRIARIGLVAEEHDASVGRRRLPLQAYLEFLIAAVCRIKEEAVHGG